MWILLILFIALDVAIPLVPYLAKKDEKELTLFKASSIVNIVMLVTKLLICLLIYLNIGSIAEEFNSACGAETGYCFGFGFLGVVLEIVLAIFIIFTSAIYIGLLIFNIVLLLTAKTNEEKEKRKRVSKFWYYLNFITWLILEVLYIIIR